MACLSALLAGCTDGALLSSYKAWNERDINPDADELAEELRENGEGGEEGDREKGDTMTVPGAPAPVTAENTKARVLARCARARAQCRLPRRRTQWAVGE